MSANCRTDKNLSVSCGVKANLTNLIEQSSLRKFIFLLNFLCSESSNKDRCSIPDNLKNLSRRNFRNIHLKIGVPVISCPSIESADDCNCIKSCEVSHGSVIDSAEHINLSSANISLMFVVNSVLIKPIVKVRLEVNVVSEVSWPRRSDKELRFVRHRVIVIELFGRTFVVLTDKTEIEGPTQMNSFLLLHNRATRLAFDKNNIQIIIKTFINSIGKTDSHMFKIDVEGFKYGIL